MRLGKRYIKIRSQIRSKSKVHKKCQSKINDNKETNTEENNKTQEKTPESAALIASKYTLPFVTSLMFSKALSTELNRFFM